MKVTKEQWQQILEAHLAFEEVGGDREREWKVETQEGCFP